MHAKKLFYSRSSVDDWAALSRDLIMQSLFHRPVISQVIAAVFGAVPRVGCLLLLEDVLR